MLYDHVKILWNVEEGNEQATNSRGVISGDPYLEVGQVPMGWYPVEDHI